MVVALTSLTVSHPDPDRLASLLAALGAAGVSVTGGSPSLVAALMTPNGLVELH